MGSQIGLTVSIVMIVLFSIAIFGFAIGFANDNNAAFSIASDPTVSEVYNLHQGNMSSLKNESEDTFKSILDTTVEPGSDVVQSAAPFAITTRSLMGSIRNMATLPARAIFGGAGSPFGIFFTILASVIVFMFGLYLYKTLRGNP